MIELPVITSILSAKELGEFAQEKYGLNVNLTCRLIRTGMNHTYLINNNETKYILRVYSYNWRSQLEIVEELNLLNLLKNNNISVSFPIEDVNGELIQQIKAPEGVRCVVLFSFAEGDKIRFLNKQTCYSIGSIISKMHNVTANKNINRIDYNVETLLKAPYEEAKLFFSEKLEEMKFIKEEIDKIGSVFKEQENNTSNGIVHLDIWYDNINIADKNEITVFDFDFCGNGSLVLDVAYFCMQLFHIEIDKTEYEIKLKEFLKGYNTNRDLSDLELQLIPYAGSAIWIFYLGIQVKRFDWSNIFLSENYLKMYIGKMKSWIEYNNIVALQLKNK